MSILSRPTYSLEVKLNIFLEAFEFERRVKDSESQVDALLKNVLRKNENLKSRCHRVFD